MIPWTDPRLLRVTALRLRLVRPGAQVLTVVGCEGYTAEGPVQVEVPFHELPTRNYRGTMLDWARRDNVYLNGLGIIEALILERSPNADE